MIKPQTAKEILDTYAQQYFQILRTSPDGIGVAIVTRKRSEALTQLKTLFDYVIGEDDLQKASGPLFKEARNKLRGQQRQRMNEVLGLEDI